MTERSDLEKLLGLEEEPSVQEAATIDALVEEYVKLTVEIENLDTELKTKRARKYALETVQLVDAMHTAKRQELVTDGLMQLKLSDQLVTSLPKRDDGKRKTTIDYVRANGGADIIKNVITVPVKGDNQATIVKTFLNEVQVPYKEDEDIHPQTYNKFCREKLERDHDLDFDKANAFLQTVVEVKPFTSTTKVKVGRKGR